MSPRVGDETSGVTLHYGLRSLSRNVFPRPQLHSRIREKNTRRSTENVSRSWRRNFWEKSPSRATANQPGNSNRFVSWFLLVGTPRQTILSILSISHLSCRLMSPALFAGHVPPLLLDLWPSPNEFLICEVEKVHFQFTTRLTLNESFSAQLWTSLGIWKLK